MALFHYKQAGQKKRTWIRVLSVLSICAVLVGTGGVIIARRWYGDSLKAVSQSTEVQRVKIEAGMNVDDIAELLKKGGLIRSAQAFKTYVRSEDVASELKAGEFELSPSWSVSEIVSVLVSGKEASELFTIGPGLRLDQIRDRFIKAGFNKDDVESALKASAYKDHPALVGKPDNATLEGYLYPDSFRITSASTPNELITQSLDELDEILTPDLIKGFNSKGLTTFEALTLASIVEKEVPHPEDRKIVAQIFLKRLKEGIALGSDATYYYASAVFGGEPFPDLDSPYNTRLYTGLPPGPINNVSKTALEAVAFPSETNYLFFVTGDDGVNHYSSTVEEHEAATEQYCKVSCATGYIPEGH